MLKKTSYLVLLGLLYFALSAMATNAFMQRWGFRELPGVAFSFQRMLDGSARRPWAYRVLVPQTVNAVASACPQALEIRLQAYLLKDSGVKDRYFRGADADWTLDYALRYHIAYGLVFLSLFTTLWLLRSLPAKFGIRNPWLNDLAPLAFATLLPLAYLNGGYLYDYPELIFLAGSFVLIHSRAWALPLLIPLATLNKETALLIPILLLPVVATQPVDTRRRALAALGIAFVAGTVTYLIVQWLHRANTGGLAEPHLALNARYWIDPRNYLFGFSSIFAAGLPTAKPLNIVVLGSVITLGVSSWRRVSVTIRRMLIVALAVNVPLVLALSYQDELRNLSLSFMPIYVYFVAAASLRKTPDGVAA